MISQRHHAPNAVRHARLCIRPRVPRTVCAFIQCLQRSGYKRTTRVAYYIQHTTYNAQRAKRPSLTLHTCGTQPMTLSIQRATAIPPFRATERLHRTVHDTSVPHHATCNIQHIAAYSGSHTTYTLLKAPYPHRGMQHRGQHVASSTRFYGVRTQRAHAPPRHPRSFRP